MDYRDPWFPSQTAGNAENFPMAWRRYRNLRRGAYLLYTWCFNLKQQVLKYSQTSSLVMYLQMFMVICTRQKQRQTERATQWDTERHRDRDRNERDTDGREREETKTERERERERARERERQRLRRRRRQRQRQTDRQTEGQTDRQIDRRLYILSRVRVHKSEAMYISLIDIQGTSTETKSF